MKRATRNGKRVLLFLAYLAAYSLIVLVARRAGNSDFDSYAAGVISIGVLGFAHHVYHWLRHSPDWNRTYK